MESNLDPWSMTATTAALTIFFFFIIKKWKQPKPINLPPSPKKLPIIGNLHLMFSPPFRCFRELAKECGPLMHLKLGEVDTVVVSSPELAKQVFKEKELVFADKIQSICLKIFWYNYVNIGFSPYGEYWRQMRKICIIELLSAKSVRSSSFIRKDEVSHLVESLRLSAGEPVNLTQKVFALISSITCRSAFGKVVKDKDSLIELVRAGLEMSAGLLIADIFPSSLIANALCWTTKRKLTRMRRELDVILDDIIREHETNRASGATGNGEFGNEDLVDVLLRVKDSGELEFPIGYDNIKAVLFDMFAGGTETSSSTVDWAMTELVRNPRVMAKLQGEIRQMVMEKDKGGIEEADIQKLTYLKLVMMETLRLHPQGSAIPRVTREACVINGYTIPKKVKVFINMWAIHRDPEYWEDAESFKPERFENQPSFEAIASGSDYRYLPFGTGKRMCPGMTFALASIALPLAQLLYNFNWELPAGIDPQHMNMMETSGLTPSRKDQLFLVATPYQPSL